MNRIPRLVHFNKPFSVPTLLNLFRDDALATSLTTIGVTLSKHETTEAQLSSARKTAKAALKKRLQGLRGELNQVLTDDDVRWKRFGYTSPADRREARRLTLALQTKPGKTVCSKVPCDLLATSEAEAMAAWKPVR
jgi:hypothetical protein